MVWYAIDSFAGGMLIIIAQESHRTRMEEAETASQPFFGCEIDNDRIPFLPQEWSSNGTADRGVVHRYRMSGMSGNPP